MKILQFGKYYPPVIGGIEKVIQELTEGLNEAGIQTDVLCSNARTQTSMEQQNNYTIIRAGRLFHLSGTAISIKLILWLWKLRNSYDVIHLHHPDPMATLAWLLVRPKAKLVIHWHSDIVKQKLIYFFFRHLETSLLKKADKVIVTSQPYLESSLPLRKFVEKCVVVPIGINFQEMRENQQVTKNLLQKYRGKKIVFSLGRDTEYKGFQYLAEATGILPEEYVVVIAGKNVPDSDRLQEIEKKYLGRLILLPSIVHEEIVSWYKVASVFVLPSVSRNEAFGIVQVEAMYFGTPVVSTEIPGSGVSWVNQNNESGLTVFVRDAQALAAGITKIGDDSRLRAKFSKGATKRAVKYFSREAMIRKVKEIYLLLN